MAFPWRNFCPLPWNASFEADALSARVDQSGRNRDRFPQSLLDTVLLPLQADLEEPGLVASAVEPGELGGDGEAGESRNELVRVLIVGTAPAVVDGVAGDTPASLSGSERTYRIL